MNLRPCAVKDEPVICGWTGDARAHALWCAGRFPYPLTAEAFDAARKAHEAEWGSVCLVAAEGNGPPLGCFFLTESQAGSSAWISFVLTDPAKRGRGFGLTMIRLAAARAFTRPCVENIKLFVFDANPSAVRCYQKAGFAVATHEASVFSYQNERWGRYLMELRRGG